MSEFAIGDLGDSLVRKRIPKKERTAADVLGASPPVRRKKSRASDATMLMREIDRLPDYSPGVSVLSLLKGHGQSLASKVSYLAYCTNKSAEEVLSELLSAIYFLEGGIDFTRISPKFAGRYLLNVATLRAKDALLRTRSKKEAALYREALPISSDAVNLPACDDKHVDQVISELDKQGLRDTLSPVDAWVFDAIIAGESSLEIARVYAKHRGLAFYPSLATKLVSRFVAKNASMFMSYFTAHFGTRREAYLAMREVISRTQSIGDAQ